jgi:hypothetical protein
MFWNVVLYFSDLSRVIILFSIQIENMSHSLDKTENVMCLWIRNYTNKFCSKIAI